MFGKLLIFIVIFVSLFEVRCATDILAHSLLQTTVCFKKTLRSHIQILKQVNASSTHVADEIVSILTSNINESAQFTISDTWTMMNANTQETSINIIFIDSNQASEMFQNQLKSRKFSSAEVFFVISLIDKIDFMNKIFLAFWENSLFNINIVSKVSHSEVNMFTFHPFNVHLCNDMTPVKINSFDRKSMKWRNSEMFPDKFKNLHQCSLKIGANERPALLEVSRFHDDSIKLGGFEGELLNELAKKLNFSIQVGQRQNASFVFDNGTAIGMFELLQDSQIDVIVSLSLQLVRTKYFSASISHFSDAVVLVIPPPTAVSPLMKLFHVYTPTALKTVYAFFTLQIIIISIIKILPSKYYNFIIGSNVKSPILNLFAIATGISINQVPKRNFARFLMISIVMFSLIIRTMFMGRLFDIMKWNIYPDELKSVEELAEANFEFYMHPGMALKFEGFKLYNP